MSRAPDVHVSHAGAGVRIDLAADEQPAGIDVDAAAEGVVPGQIQRAGAGLIENSAPPITPA